MKQPTTQKNTMKNQTHKHTPTPWVSSPDSRGSSFVWKRGDEQPGSNRIAIAHIQYNGEANAAHIVKCVNAHDELVDLCVQLSDLCDRAGYHTHAKNAEAILAKLEGGAK